VGSKSAQLRSTREAGREQSREQPDNAELSDRNPLDVWKAMKANQRDCAVAQLCFVASENLLRREAYEEFVEFRSAKLAEPLNDFIGLGGRK